MGFTGSSGASILGTNNTWTGTNEYSAKVFHGATAYNRLGTTPLEEWGGANSSFGLNIQDGSGRVNYYWNTAGTTSPTQTVANEDAFRLNMTVDPPQLTFFGWEGSTSAAGSAITWSEIFKVTLTDNSPFFRTNVVWHAGNDGAGSGLDADLLDGYNVGTSGGAIPLLNGTNTWSAAQTFTAASGAIVLRSDEASIKFDEGGGTFRWLFGIRNDITGNDSDMVLWANGTGTALQIVPSTRVVDFKVTPTLNGVAIPTISSTDTLSNKTLSSPTLSGTVAGSPTFSGTLSSGTSTGVRWYAYSTSAANSGAGVDLSGNGYELSLFAGGNLDAAGRISFGRRRSDTGTYTERMYLDLNTGSLVVGGSTVWHAGNDGSGSGLDADLLDGYQWSTLVQTGSNTTWQTYWYPGGDYYTTIHSIGNDFNNFRKSGSYHVNDTASNHAASGNYGYLRVWQHTGANYMLQEFTTSGSPASTWRRLGYDSSGSQAWTGWNKYWSDGNDGAGSGLDADLLDGYNAAVSSSSGTPNTIVLRDASGDIYTRYNFAAYHNSSDDIPASVPTYLMGKFGDNYHRSATADLVRSFLAGTLNGASVGLTNWNTEFGNTKVSGMRFSGDTASGAGTGGPGGTWWFVENMRHSNDSNLWGVQIAWGWEDNANRLKTRNVQGGSFGGWVTYWNDNNDGSGSGLDADLWDGNNFATYLNQAVLTSSVPTFGGALFTGTVTINAADPVQHWYVSSAGTNNKYWRIHHGSVNQYYEIVDDAYTTATTWMNVIRSAMTISSINLYSTTLTHNSNTVWTSGNDGSGSGLDADLLDGYQATSFLIGGNYANQGNWEVGHASNTNDTFGGLELREAGRVGAAQSAASYAPGINFHWGSRAAARIYMNASGEFVLGGQSDIANNRRNLLAAGIWSNGNVVWNAGNDGSGSGLDADLLDGYNNLSFLRYRQTYDTSTNWNSMTPSQYQISVDQINNGAGWTNAPGGYSYGGLLSWYLADHNFQLYVPHTASDTNGMWYRSGWNGSYYGWKRIWDSGNDGSGSGLDADLLDGYNVGTSGGTIPLLNGTNTWSNAQTFSSSITVSQNNATGGGIILADDGDIVDLNDGYCAMRFSLGVRIHGGNRSGDPVYILDNQIGSSQLESGRGFVINGSYRNGQYSTRLRKWDDGGGLPLYVQQTTGTANSWSNVASFGASNARYHFHVDGIAYSSSDFRAPIFYDSDNTGYYLNPAGSSFIWQTQIVNNAFTAGADTYTAEIYAPDSGDGTKQVSIRFHQGGRWYFQIRANNAGFRFTEGNTNNLTTVTMGNTYTNSLGVGTDFSGTTGEIRATNNITAYYSDDRLKTRISNIPNALEKILSLNGFYFQANEKAQELGYTNEVQVGVSAQEVEAILPEIVVPAPIDEQYKTVRYEKLIPLLIEAIKELKREIDGLKNATSR
jgi:hypothetical protein